MRPTVCQLVPIGPRQSIRAVLSGMNHANKRHGMKLGLIGIAGSNFTYYYTISETNVATAILLQYLAPTGQFLTAVIAFFALLASVLLMTCSARLPVYALLIGAFIPRRQVWGGLEILDQRTDQ